MRRKHTKKNDLFCMVTANQVKAQHFCFQYIPKDVIAFQKEALIDEKSTRSLLDADRLEEFGDIFSARFIRFLHARIKRQIVNLW